MWMVVPDPAEECEQLNDLAQLSEGREDAGQCVVVVVDQRQVLRETRNRLLRVVSCMTRACSATEFFRRSSQSSIVEHERVEPLGHVERFVPGIEPVSNFFLRSNPIPLGSPDFFCCPIQ